MIWSFERASHFECVVQSVDAAGVPEDLSSVGLQVLWYHNTLWEPNHCFSQW